MKIELVEYDPGWVKMYEDMKALFQTSLGDKIAGIEHIGSTSVPELCAKPVIDILLGVRNLADADELVPQIVKLGFEYISTYEDEMPYRRYFVKKENGVHVYHVHTVIVGSPFWVRHLAFRDYLRKDPKTRDEYAKLKMDLAQREWKDGNEYADAKTDFIRSTEHKAQPSPKVSRLK